MKLTKEQLAMLETPCVILDVAQARRNIEAMQAAADAAGCALRPHIKTHKMAVFARMQVEGERIAGHHLRQGERGRDDGGGRPAGHFYRISHGGSISYPARAGACAQAGPPDSGGGQLGVRAGAVPRCGTSGGAVLGSASGD